MTSKEIEKVLSGEKRKVTIFYKRTNSQNIGDFCEDTDNLRTSHDHRGDTLVCTRGLSIPPYAVCLLKEIIAIKDGQLDAHPSLQFGSDPELFYEIKGVMVPSTQVIINDTELVTKDGFQVELHPPQTHCRQISASRIGRCLNEASLLGNIVGAKLSFKLAYRVDDKVWKKTNKATKMFGCHPTENAQEKNPKRVTGLREKFRAGGGHIHLGGLTGIEKRNLPTIIKIMDIVVGNTLVLLDRDEANITRRKNYGRAGEYRPKPYGLEYRVPSNFWLKHYVLWSLASGQMRNAIAYYRLGLTDELFKRFDMRDIRNAINNNDYDLALNNFMKYTEFLRDVNIPMNSAISVHNVDKFLSWIKEKNPLQKLGKLTDSSIRAHWVQGGFTGREGFELFINRIKVK